MACGGYRRGIVGGLTPTPSCLGAGPRTHPHVPANPKKTVLGAVGENSPNLMVDSCFAARHSIDARSSEKFRIYHRYLLNELRQVHPKMWTRVHPRSPRRERGSISIIRVALRLLRAAYAKRRWQPYYSDVARRVNHALPACRTCGDATFRMRTVNNVGESVLLHRDAPLHTPDPFFPSRLRGDEYPTRRQPSLF